MTLDQAATDYAKKYELLERLAAKDGFREGFKFAKTSTMKLAVDFIDYLPLSQTLIFEKEYPAPLQCDLDTKLYIKEKGGDYIWMVDRESRELIGETYYVPLDAIKEEMAGTGVDEWYGKNVMYVYGTTILPKFQRQGYGKLLKAYMLAELKAKNVPYTIGHARNNGSIQLNKFFGAKVIGKQSDWQGTGEEVLVYLQKVNSLKEQDKDWNCGAFAVSFLLLLNGVNIKPEAIDPYCTEESGISHSKIVGLIGDLAPGITITNSYENTIEHLSENLPALVNYQNDGDGHYGVVLNIYGEVVEVYNPDNGLIDKMKISDFEHQWYSERYGKRWLLTLSNGK